MQLELHSLTWYIGRETPVENIGLCYSEKKKSSSDIARTIPRYFVSVAKIAWSPQTYYLPSRAHYMLWLYANDIDSLCDLTSIIRASYNSKGAGRVTMCMSTLAFLTWFSCQLHLEVFLINVHHGEAWLTMDDSWRSMQVYGIPTDFSLYIYSSGGPKLLMGSAHVDRSHLPFFSVRPRW